MGGLLALLAIGCFIAGPLLAWRALARSRELHDRLDALEREVRRLRRGEPLPGSRPAVQESAAAGPPPAPGAQVQVPAPALPASSPVAPVSLPRVSAAWQAPPREPDVFERAVHTVARWFSEGNAPVKVGVLVLFAGVAALLKYAADQGWMRFPIQLRLLGVAAAALAAFAFGWRQRRQRRTFALSIQGGAIGVLLLVVYAAFKPYGLIGAAPAFVLFAVLAGGAGLLAVLQESRALAVLGILAGFAAPILLPTGGGHHVALFGWYAVLNAAIFGVAWLRSWPALNLLGFAFTYGIGIWWGVLDYAPAKLASTLPFLALFFAFYLLIPVSNARRAPGGTVDGCLVFGAPLLSFALLAGLLEGARMPLAAVAVGLAVLYAVLRLLPLVHDHALLRQAWLLLAAAFATLAVPLALSAHATAAAFAVEGAALVWLGLRQQRPLQRWSGGALQLLSAIAYLYGHEHAPPGETPLANPRFMATLLLALAGFASALWHLRADRRDVATGYYLWGLLWWVLAGSLEIARFVPGATRPDFMLAFIVLTAGLAGLALRWTAGAALAWTAAAGAFLAVNLATLRGVYYLGGVPWNSALFDSALAQAALTLVWSVLGVVGWIAGSRLRHRTLWTAGAVLMGVVLAKLLVIDRGHLGNLPGIASFIGYGLLCTVVGYLTPAPPRREAA